MSIKWVSLEVPIQNADDKETANERTANHFLCSWVMLDSSNPQAFVNLPGERALYSSPTRTAFSLSTSNSLPGATPIKLNSSSGVVHLTNQRVRIHLPVEPDILI